MQKAPLAVENANRAATYFFKPSLTALVCINTFQNLFKIVFNSLSLISSFPGVWNHFDPHLHLFFDDNFGFNLYLGIEMQICDYPQSCPPAVLLGLWELVGAEALCPWPGHPSQASQVL